MSISNVIVTHLTLKGPYHHLFIERLSDEERINGDTL